MVCLKGGCGEGWWKGGDGSNGEDVLCTTMIKLISPNWDLAWGVTRVQTVGPVNVGLIHGYPLRMGGMGGGFVR